MFIQVQSNLDSTKYGIKTVHPIAYTYAATYTATDTSRLCWKRSCDVHL